MRLWKVVTINESIEDAGARLTALEEAGWIVHTIMPGPKVYCYMDMAAKPGEPWSAELLPEPTPSEPADPPAETKPRNLGGRPKGSKNKPRPKPKTGVSTSKGRSAKALPKIS